MSNLIFFKKRMGFHFPHSPQLSLRTIRSHVVCLLGLLTIFFFYFYGDNTVYAQTAANLKPTISLGSGADGTVIHDNNYATYLDIPAQTTITITSSTPIHGIYLYWNQAPDGWELTSGNSSTSYGQYGILHEYVEVTAPSTSVTMVIPEGGSILCELQAFGEGEIPSNVQTWLPPCEVADLLLFPVHASDESLVFGGTIPYYAGELGKKVQVAYISRHFPDEVYREHEKLDALWAMGLRNYPVMGKFEDKFTSGHTTSPDRYDYDAVLEYVVTQVRRFQPLVILGHDLDGEYGHGLHMLAAKAVQNAMSLSNDSSYHLASADQYGLWEPNKTYLHLFDQNPIRMDWNKPLKKFNKKTALQLAQESFLLNASQKWTNFKPSDTGKNNCADFGLYLSSVGPDKEGDDFLENVPLRKTNTRTDTRTTERLDAVMSDVPDEDTETSPENSSTDSETTAYNIETDRSNDASDDSSASSSASSTTETSDSKPNRLESFEQSYLEIEPLVLKVGSICIVIVAIGSFLSLFIKK